jgi:hypothetical protein
MKKFTYNPFTSRPDYVIPDSGGGGPVTVDWGDIGGVLSNQTDLQAALDAKQDTLTIHPDSVSYLEIVGGNQLRATQLLITDVTVDAVQLNLAAWVAANYTGSEYQEGDVVVLTIPGESYIHNGGVAGTVADFTQLNIPVGGFTFTSGLTNTAGTVTLGGALTQSAIFPGNGHTVEYGTSGNPLEIYNVFTEDGAISLQNTEAGTGASKLALAGDETTWELSADSGELANVILGLSDIQMTFAGSNPDNRSRLTLQQTTSELRTQQAAGDFAYVQVTPLLAALYSEDATGDEYSSLEISNGGFYWFYENSLSGAVREIQWVAGDNHLVIYDEDGYGAQYSDNYAANNAANPRWIPDKGYVDSILSGGTGIYGGSDALIGNTILEMGSNTLTFANTNPISTNGNLVFSIGNSTPTVNINNVSTYGGYGISSGQGGVGLFFNDDGGVVFLGASSSGVSTGADIESVSQLEWNVTTETLTINADNNVSVRNLGNEDTDTRLVTWNTAGTVGELRYRTLASLGILGAGNGLVVNGTNLDLGGTLADDVTFDGDGGSYTFNFGQTGGTELSGFNVAAVFSNMSFKGGPTGVDIQWNPGNILQTITDGGTGLGTLQMTSGQLDFNVTDGSTTGAFNATPTTLSLTLALSVGLEMTGSGSEVNLRDSNGNRIYQQSGGTFITTTGSQLLTLSDALTELVANNGSSLSLSTNNLFTDGTATGGIRYAADYSGQYVARSLIDLGYATTHIGAQNVDALVTTPTGAEDGFVIAWNNANSEYELVAQSGGGGLGAGSGLTENGGNIDLGGSLTESAIVEPDVNDTRFVAFGVANRLLQFVTTSTNLTHQITDGITTSTILVAPNNYGLTVSGTISLTSTASGLVTISDSNAASVRLDNGNITLTTGSTLAGASYSADYAAANVANPRWIPDKAYVDSVAGGGNTIYSADDTLAGARTVTLGANNLTFDGTGGGDVIIDGNLNVTGIIDPIGLLFEQTDTTTIGAVAAGTTMLYVSDGTDTFNAGQLVIKNNGGAAAVALNSGLTTIANRAVRYTDTIGSTANSILEVNPAGRLVLHPSGSDDGAISGKNDNTSIRYGAGGSAANNVSMFVRSLNDGHQIDFQNDNTTVFTAAANSVHLSFAAGTTTTSQLRFGDGVQRTTPVDGDLSRVGDTLLYFTTNAGTRDLLAPYVTFDDLPDVDAPTPSVGDFLQYQGSGNYENVAGADVINEDYIFTFSKGQLINTGDIIDAVSNGNLSTDIGFAVPFACTIEEISISFGQGTGAGANVPVQIRAEASSAAGIGTPLTSAIGVLKETVNCAVDGGAAFHRVYSATGTQSLAANDLLFIAIGTITGGPNVQDIQVIVRVKKS